MGWWPCEPRKHLVGASQLWRAGVLLGRGCWDMGGSLGVDYSWDPPDLHLLRLCQRPLGPGHNLGKGFRTPQGAEFLDLVTGHAVFRLLPGKGLWS